MLPDAVISRKLSAFSLDSEHNIMQHVNADLLGSMIVDLPRISFPSFSA